MEILEQTVSLLVVKINGAILENKVGFRYNRRYILITEEISLSYF